MYDRYAKRENGQRERNLYRDYIFLRYYPPTSNIASVNWPRVQHLTASINSEKMFRFVQRHFLPPIALFEAYNVLHVKP